MEKIKSWLNSPENGSALALYRIFFGFLMVYQTWYYHSSGLLAAGLVNPKLHFSYDGLGFLQPMSLPAMQFVLFLMGACSLAIAAGVFFRIACIGYTLCHAYLFFIDKSIFNNHIYLFLLLGTLFALTDADRIFSLRKTKGFDNQLPRWQTFIIQAQFAILYIYGAFAKISVDWFVHFEPLHSMIAAIPENAGGWGGFVKNYIPAWFFSHGGFWFDLLIPLLLWYRPTRYWSIPPAIFFHFSNSVIFRDIGIFPYFSVASMIVFFNGYTFDRWFSKKQTEPAQQKQAQKQPQKKSAPSEKTFAPALLEAWREKAIIAFFAFQLLFPFRGLLLPNPIDYTTVANRFSWRMKSHARESTQVSMRLEDRFTGKAQEIPLDQYLNTMQISLLTLDARAPVTFAKFIAKEAREKFGVRDPVVKAQIKIKFNGRPEQFFIDPNRDLSKVNYSPFSKIDWTMPLAAFPKK